MWYSTFFEWTLVRRQSQTNNQAICGKANSSLDATLVISAAGLLEVNSLRQFLSYATNPTTISRTTNSKFSQISNNQIVLDKKLTSKTNW